jgi:phosphoenolpyruvate synthase/pyruvate phosphate dikinase
MDGSKGEVYLGKVAKVEPKLTGDFASFMKWVDEYRTLGVRTNADTPHDAGVARAFGAEGIGLCRTEHMFFEGKRIDAVREMILADDEKGRRKALNKILPMQREDFKGIFTAMAGLPVTIRTLDPPLHEFLPHGPKRDRGPGQGHEGETSGAGRQGGVPGRSQPHAGPPRLPPGHRLSRDHRDAGPGHFRGRLQGDQAGQAGLSRDHDPLGGHAQRASAAKGDRDKDRRRGDESPRA